MSHYDEAYEEMAAQSRRLTELEQSRCDHRNSWVPIRCDDTGRNTHIMCPLCKLVKEV